MKEIEIVSGLSECRTIDSIMTEITERLTNQLSKYIYRKYDDTFELRLDPNDEKCRYSLDVYLTRSYWNYYTYRDERTQNIYRSVKGSEIKINWPAFGSLEATLAYRILAFYAEVSKICEEISKEYENETFVTLFQTREDELKREQQKIYDLNVKLVQQSIAEHVKGMRVNGNKTVQINDGNITEGYYTVKLNNKSFFCTVCGSNITFSRSV